VTISIAWASGVITVPQSFLTPLGGTTYQLDLDVFRLALKDLEDDEDGMPWPRTHNHNTEVTLAGITFARSIEIIQPYKVQFEDGVYGVNLVGANSNVPDVLIRNSVSVNTQNSAGLVAATGVDQAAVQAALTAQGYTVARAPKLDALDAIKASTVLFSGVVLAGSTPKSVKTNMVTAADNANIGLSLVVIHGGGDRCARTIRSHAGGDYELSLPMVCTAQTGDMVYITSHWILTSGTAH